MASDDSEGPTPLGPGAEFDLIRAVLDGSGPVRGVLAGSGDDAAVLAGGWVVSCDLSIEDVHFRRGWLSASELGARAVRAALSDLAAMAAEPVAILLALAGAPADHADGTLAAVGLGAREAAAELGAGLIGGDLARSPGPLVMDVVALGRAESPLMRSGARAGEEVWVSGPLGGAAAAVAIFGDGGTPPARLRAAFVSPPSRVAAARALAEAGCASALIDLSDGLAGDAAHLAAASGVHIELDEAAIPVHAEARRALGDAAALECALRGGEDYELLWTAPPESAERLVSEASAVGFEPTRVGRVGDGAGVALRGRDGVVRSLAGAFDHFAGPGPA